MSTVYEAPSNHIVFSKGWRACSLIRGAVSRALSLEDMSYKFIIFMADMKTTVATRTAIRKSVSYISEIQEPDNFLNVLYDDVFMEDEGYSQKLARAISYLTTKPVYICRDGDIIEVTNSGTSQARELPLEYDNLFRSPHIQHSRARTLPHLQNRLRHYLDNGHEKALLLSIKHYLDVTEPNAQIRSITKEVFVRMNSD